MTELIKHPEFGEVRTQIVKGEPLFCAADVCVVLNFAAAPEVVLRKLDDDEKLMRKVSASGQTREMWFVNESGLYTLIMRSNKPAAKQFRKWVTGEVLPSIRRNGYYVHPELMSRKDEARFKREMFAWVDRYLTEDDCRKVAKKFGIHTWDVGAVTAGRRVDNAVMQECQQRALINKEKELNAYHPNRVREVLDKLSK